MVNIFIKIIRKSIMLNSIIFECYPYKIFAMIIKGDINFTIKKKNFIIFNQNLDITNRELNFYYFESDSIKLSFILSIIFWIWKELKSSIIYKNSSISLDISISLLNLCRKALIIHFFCKKILTAPSECARCMYSSIYKGKF